MDQSHATMQTPPAPSTSTSAAASASALRPQPTPPPRRSSKDSKDVPRAAPQLIDTLARQRLAARAVTPDMPADQILPGIPRSHSPYYTTSDAPDSYPVTRPQSPPSPISPRTSHSALDTPASSRTDSGRLRTRTLEGLSSQHNGIQSKNGARQRVGSLNQTFELPLRASESGHLEQGQTRNRRTSSAGNQQRMSVQSHALSKRQLSPAPNAPTPHNASDQSSHPGFDPRTMLTLMHKARGRMKGQVAYRQIYRNTWTVALCSIDPEEGCLLCESDPDSNRHMVLVPDLRGCSVTASLDRTRDQAAAKPILTLNTVDETITIQLKPLNEDYFHAWFASLLCWQPVPPGGQVDQLSSQQPIPISFGSGSATAPLRGTPKDKARVIKTGKAILIETEEVAPKSRHSARSLHSRSGPIHTHSSTRLSTVTCVLSEDGTFKISSDPDNSFIARVSLALLCRSAVQRVHHSVWDLDRCMGIFPQYSHAADACSQIRPLFLAFDERVVYEAWFVLLRCFTVPELYGPENTSLEDIEVTTEVLPGLPRSEMPGLLRIERFMQLKVTEAKLRKSRRTSTIAPGANSSSNPVPVKPPAIYYVDIVVDGQRKAKTSLKRTASDPYWYESFELPDLATATSTLSLRLKKFEGFKLQNNDALGDEQPVYLTDEFEKVEHHQGNEELVGETTVSLTDIEYSKDIEKWWTLKDENGDEIGEVLFKLRFDEDPILMDREYEHLYELLHDFPKPLTIQIGERIPNELTSLAMYLLNIFQTTDEAENWLRVLCEEEIDGIMKETPSKMTSRFAKRLDSNESKDSSLQEMVRDAGDDRHSLLRDLGRSATAEANLLFRGNTLASKAMDAHMKRLGRAYLESTIAPKLRDIAHKDLDCEVNPNKVTDKRTLQKNWEKLLQITEDMWKSIKGSAERCPPELRVIFRHIRECANDRYGYFMRTVPYSSVSGFLFLRFFCAAILSPQAFDILRNEPSARAIRTFTLVAKGLQGLANMTPFGNKEPWMENMNKFLNAHKVEFKEFIDTICDVTSNMSLHEPSPSYSTPLQIYRRLPQRSKEGFLSLPYHIDRPHNSACLVKLWLDHVQKTSNVDGPGLSGDLARFHDLCLRLRQRTQVCYDRIERSERRSSSWSQRWVSIAERMEKHPDQFWIRQRAVTPNPANGIPPPISDPPPIPPPPREATPVMRPTFGLRSSSDWSIRRRAMAYSPPFGASEDELNSAGERFSGPTTPGADDDSSLCSSDTETIGAAKKEKKGLRLPFGRKKKHGEKEEDKAKKQEESKIRKKGPLRRDA